MCRGSAGPFKNLKVTTFALHLISRWMKSFHKNCFLLQVTWRFTLPTEHVSALLPTRIRSCSASRHIVHHKFTILKKPCLIRCGLSSRWSLKLSSNLYSLIAMSQPRPNALCCGSPQANCNKAFSIASSRMHFSIVGSQG